MEQDLFSWKDWDADDNWQQFTDCVLKQDLFGYKTGYEIPMIEINAEKGIISLFEDLEEGDLKNKPSSKWKLSYTVGEQIK